MPRIPEMHPSSDMESLLTHPREQLELAAQMPWWGWMAVAGAMLFSAALIYYFWPRKDRCADLPRDDDGRLIPPWQWQQQQKPPAQEGP